MERQYIKRIIKEDMLTAMQYKILFVLMTGEYTQVQLSYELNVAKQSINPLVKDLLNKRLIRITKVEGRNKWLTCDSDVIIREKKIYQNKVEDMECLVEQYKSLTIEEIDDLDLDELARLAKALLFKFEDKIGVKGSLLDIDNDFCDYLFDDGIASSLKNIANGFNYTNDNHTTCYSYWVGKDTYLDVSFKFTNEDINEKYILDLLNGEHDHSDWESICNEEVEIIKVQLI